MADSAPFQPDDGPITRPRWRYLLLAAAIFCLAALLLAGLWQVSGVFPGLAGATATLTAGDTARPAARLATATPLPPTATPAPTPAIQHPTVAGLSAEADDRARTIVFQADVQVPPQRGIAEVLLWYDTEAGQRVRRFDGSPLTSLSLSYRLDAASEGLTRTLTTTAEMDYWWLARDTAGEAARAGGTVLLSPVLQALVVTPTPEPPPTDFTWAISESAHYRFYYMPGTAAARDLSHLAVVAEAALERIESVLETDLQGQMSVYFVPRVFWQGGAAYGNKVQLISYLDRNYTGVETWSYFTHEGTHALAQDLIRPKEEKGGPDGVLVEGLALWASGGHYRREPLDEWAAVVAASDDYIPLAELRAGPFYDFQHETSYLEAGSFVKFLVERYGLEAFKELYGLTTGDAAHDEALVRRLYGRSYADLEAEWLAYLAGLSPTAEQAEAWHLEVRAFDLMRRYQTMLDPDARILPDSSPTDWTSDTLKIFLRRADGPVNVVLETAFLTVQERLHGGDQAGAAALLDDIEAALDAGGELSRPSLAARLAILDLLAAQDRAILRADADAYRATLDPAYARSLGDEVEASLQMPFTAYRQEVVRLDIANDGRSAQGTVLLHAGLVEGAFPGNGLLSAVTFARTAEGWLLTGCDLSDR